MIMEQTSNLKNPNPDRLEERSALCQSETGRTLHPKESMCLFGEIIWGCDNLRCQKFFGVSNLAHSSTIAKNMRIKSNKKKEIVCMVNVYHHTKAMKHSFLKVYKILK